MVVVNMADRPGTPETVRHLRLTLGRDLPIATTVATEGTGVEELRAMFDERWAGAGRQRRRPRAAGPQAGARGGADRRGLDPRVRRGDRAEPGPEHRGQGDPGGGGATMDHVETEPALDAERVRRWREERLARDYERVPPRREESTTLSGIPIDDVYTPAGRRGHRPGARHRAAGRVPLHARPAREHVPRPAVDDPPGRRLRPGRGHQRPLQVPARARRDRAVDRLRPADAARLRLRPRDLPARDRQDRRRRRHGRRHARAVRRHPARRGLDLADDQRPGGGAARDVPGRRATSAGSPGDAAHRHDAERHPQGVHGPERVHLPAGCRRSSSSSTRWSTAPT